MTKKILVTGGAGFIGSHLVDKLINEMGHQVTVIDILEEQVHGKTNKPPDYLNKDALFIHGSITDIKTLKELVKDNEIIFHLAAMVGVGQSMYQIKKYIKHNILGTANLLEIIANSEHNVQKLVIASSNTVYGEGKSKCTKCGIIFPKLRTKTQLKDKDWENKCHICGMKVDPLLTDETAPLDPSSIYAYSKQAQEQICLLIGDTYGINTTILRFFLVYGSRQALSNPYTGVCAIFCTRLFQGKPAIVYEDGLQSRDFVNVNDICQALILAIEKEAANGEIFNVGSGMPITIKEVAEIITEKINPNLKPIYNQQYRIGDIRHCLADISKIKSKLGYYPTINFKEGIDELITWIKPQIDKFQDKSQLAMDKLREKGLLK
ncbi:MAG: NAD-dependent epimerase/dehydratase family protein [Candidatus Hodarchaeota archaeon]